jgi:ribose transport system substrate-binding protein
VNGETSQRCGRPTAQQVERSDRKNRGTAAWLGIALGMVGALTLSACSSSSSSSPSSVRPSSHAAVSASTLASLRAVVEKAEQPPTWFPPGPAVSASSVRGASILAMPVNSEIGQCQTEAEDFAALGSELGAHVTVFSDSGQPSQWETGIEDATAAHDAAIVMFCGIVPGAVAPQLQAAERAGIEVVDDNYNEVSNYQYLDAETAVDTVGGMKDDVDDALVNLHGAPLHALVVSSNSIVQGPAAQTAVTDQLRSVCPSSCSVVQDLVVPIQDWATQVESDVDAALVAHPNVNAVIVTFDGMVQFVLPAVEQAHRAGLEIYTWGASKSVEKLMEQPGSLIAADPGLDPDWGAYGAMDQVIRLLGHHPSAPVAKEVNPNRFWVPANVAAFFGPDGSYGNGGYGGITFENDFRKLWGLPPLGSS